METASSSDITSSDGEAIYILNSIIIKYIQIK